MAICYISILTSCECETDRGLGLGHTGTRAALQTTKGAKAKPMNAQAAAVLFLGVWFGSTVGRCCCWRLGTWDGQRTRATCDAVRECATTISGARAPVRCAEPERHVQ
eukprot:scaffold15143_cov103-Isochrysis_galbana.AAC.3